MGGRTCRPNIPPRPHLLLAVNFSRLLRNRTKAKKTVNWLSGNTEFDRAAPSSLDLAEGAHSHSYGHVHFWSRLPSQADGPRTAHVVPSFVCHQPPSLLHVLLRARARGMIALLYEMNGNLSCIKNRPSCPLPPRKGRTRGRRLNLNCVTRSRVRWAGGMIGLADDDDNMGGTDEAGLCLQDFIGINQRPCLLYLLTSTIFVA